MFCKTSRDHCKTSNRLCKTSDDHCTASIGHCMEMILDFEGLSGFKWNEVCSVCTSFWLVIIIKWCGNTARLKLYKEVYITKCARLYQKSFSLPFSGREKIEGESGKELAGMQKGDSPNCLLLFINQIIYLSSIIIAYI